MFDATSVDRAELDARLDVLVALADLDPRVCRPLAVDGEVVAVTGAGRAYVVCFEHADGRPPDPADPADAERMGTELAGLHRSMRRVPSTRLPLVATLRGASAEALSLGGAIQLLHGDFHAGNLRLGPAGLRIFDLDDCGHGPPAFDVANALYMVRFDSIVEGTPAVYESFERSFVPAYARTRGEPFPSAVLTHFIDLRVSALAGWIDDLASRACRDPRRVPRVARDPPRVRRDVPVGCAARRLQSIAKAPAPTSTGSSSERSPSTATSSASIGKRLEATRQRSSALVSITRSGDPGWSSGDKAVTNDVPPPGPVRSMRTVRPGLGRPRPGHAVGEHPEQGRGHQPEPGAVEQVRGQADGASDVVVVGPQLERADDEHPLHAADEVVVGDGVVGSELRGRPDEVERRQPPAAGDVGGLGGLEVGGGAAQHREVVRRCRCVERLPPSQLAEHVPLDADEVQDEVPHGHVVRRRRCAGSSRRP